MKKQIFLLLTFVGALVLIAAGLVAFHHLKLQPPKHHPPPALGTYMPVTRFLNAEGEAVDLTDYHGDYYVMLVFMRGFPGYVCPYCTQQTADLIRHRDALVKARVKCFIIYPGDQKTIPKFIAAVNDLFGAQQDLAATDLNLLLDVRLKAVKALGIQGDLARPSTFILDLDGKVFYRYIGKSPSDRPNWQDIEEVLDNLEISGK